MSAFSFEGQLQKDESNHTVDLSSDLSGLHRSTNAPCSIVRQLVNESFVDEELSDEDAWMPILDIVKAEVRKKRSIFFFLPVSVGCLSVIL